MLRNKFQNKKPFCKLKRIAGFCLTLIYIFGFSLSYSHSGFYQLSKNDVVGNYELSALQDFDIEQNAPSTGQLLLQVSHEGNAVDKATQVFATIKFEGETKFEDVMDFVGSSSQDGKTFYSSYLLSTPISELGTYIVTLDIDGEHGQASQQYFFKSQRVVTRMSQLLEVIPSVLILIICLVGGALLFLPVKKKGEQHV